MALRVVMLTLTLPDVRSIGYFPAALGPAAKETSRYSPPREGINFCGMETIYERFAKSPMRNPAISAVSTAVRGCLRTYSSPSSCHERTFSRAPP